jgi:nucleotide-binding universal stress UspA family protein
VITVVDSELAHFHWYRNRIVEPGERLIRQAAKKIQEWGFEVAPILKEGHVRAGIIDCASEWQADLIILGSREPSGLSGLLFGDVARTVARGASCSVEIVRGGSVSGSTRDAPMKILLATDGSKGALAAAQSVATRPWPANTCVLALGVADIHIRATEPVFNEPAVAEYITYQNQRAEAAVMAVREVLHEAGIVSSGEVITGNPKVALVEHARTWNADLVVVGAHGNAHHRHFMSGTVSDAVVSHCGCSVEVIRSPIGV